MARRALGLHVVVLAAMDFVPARPLLAGCAARDVFFFGAEAAAGPAAVFVFAHCWTGGWVGGWFAGVGSLLVPADALLMLEGADRSYALSL